MAWWSWDPIDVFGDGLRDQCSLLMLLLLLLLLLPPTAPRCIILLSIVSYRIGFQVLVGYVSAFGVLLRSLGVRQEAAPHGSARLLQGGNVHTGACSRRALWHVPSLFVLVS